MSQHHTDPVEENVETHPVKLAIAVTVGAIGLVIAILLLAGFAVGSHRMGETDANANTPEAVTKRIAPFVTSTVDASKAAPKAVSAASAAPAAATAGAPVVAMAIPAALPVGAAAPAGGEGVYKAGCVACHATGVAGAPKLGDKGLWGPRVAKGKPTLYEHALKGFNAMPAKGGNTALADADVKAAVDYMIAQAK
ncbi:MAG: c-type cytochrome [Betaproteobacteria bacterium]